MTTGCADRIKRTMAGREGPFLSCASCEYAAVVLGVVIPISVVVVDPWKGRMMPLYRPQHLIERGSWPSFP